MQASRSYYVFPLLCFLGEIQNFVNPKQNTHFFCVCFVSDCVVVTHFSSSSSSFGLGETTTTKKKDDDDDGGGGKK